MHMFLSQLIYVYVHMHPSIHLLALSCVLSLFLPSFLTKGHNSLFLHYLSIGQASAADAH